MLAACVNIYLYISIELFVKLTYIFIVRYSEHALDMKECHSLIEIISSSGGGGGKPSFNYIYIVCGN